MNERNGKKLFLSAVLTLGMLMSVSVSADAQSNKIRVMNAKGDATAFLPGSNRPLKVKDGDSYPVGTRIETGKNSKVGLSFGEGGLVLGASSKLGVKKLSLQKRSSRQVELDLSAGKLVAFLKKNSSPSKVDYRIRTPKGVAAARGTVWSIDLTSGMLAVFNGNVVFTPIGGASINLGPLSGVNLSGGPGGQIIQVNVSREQLNQIIRFLRNSGFTVDEVVDGGTRSLRIAPPETIVNPVSDRVTPVAP